MAKEVILTPVAIKNYDNIVTYLTRKWGTATANNFIDRFDQVQRAISRNPGIYPFEDRIKQIQKCMLTKHNVIYFKEYDEMIKILTIFDTRQNPDNLTKII